MSIPQTTDRKPLPHNWRQSIRVRPLPKNMHPTLHSGRRHARSQAQEQIYGKNPNVLYTDASPYSNPSHYLAVATTKDKIITCASIKTTSTWAAEEFAVALAITQTPATILITDCQAVCRSFLSGYVASTTWNLLAQHAPNRKIDIVWTPGHSSLTGNNFAHRQACELSSQASEETPSLVPLLTFQDITQHYRTSRQHFPPPHPQLTKTEEVILRRLQTNTFPHPTWLHRMYPTQYPATCKFCPNPCTLIHMILGCAHNPALPPLPTSLPLPELWENLTTSAGLDAQQLLVSRAETARSSHGLLD